MRQRRVSVVTVSNRSRYRSFSSNSQQPAIRKKRIKKVIHVTIGLPSGLHSTKDDVHKMGRKKKSLETSSIGRSNSTTTSRPSRSSRVAPHEIADRTGMTTDHHHKPKEKKKKKCTRRCFVVSVLVTVLIVAIFLSVLLALLLRPQTKTTPSIITSPLRWNTTGITIAGVGAIAGNATDPLNFPVDVIHDWANNLYISEYNGHRIRKYLFNTSIGMTVAGNGTAGPSPSQLHNPGRVLVDSNENIYIADAQNHRIQFWSNGTTNGTTIAGVTGSQGSANNQLALPYSIALHPTSGVLYISDYGNNRVMSYAPGANNGTVVVVASGPGTNNPQLVLPIGLHYDSFSNSLFIANSGASNIVRYVFGASGCTLVTGNINGTASASSTGLNLPTELTLDPMGNMYVADQSNHRIQFFSGGGMNGVTIAGVTGLYGSNATTLGYPWAVRLDNQLNMYVADTYNNRIQKFLRY